MRIKASALWISRLEVLIAIGFSRAVNAQPAPQTATRPEVNVAGSTPSALQITDVVAR